MITISDIRIDKYKFFIPFAVFILFILKPEKSPNKNLIVVYYFAEPARVHNNYFLPAFIADFLFGLVT